MAENNFHCRETYTALKKIALLESKRTLETYYPYILHQIMKSIINKKNIDTNNQYHNQYRYWKKINNPNAYWTLDIFPIILMLRFGFYCIILTVLTFSYLARFIKKILTTNTLRWIEPDQQKTDSALHGHNRPHVYLLLPEVGLNPK